LRLIVKNLARLVGLIYKEVAQEVIPPASSRRKRAMLTDLSYVLVVVLVPVIPAFLLYKFLPAGRTNVGGPFRGLDIKLSGAFAGYFLVVLITSSLVVFLIQKKPPPSPYQYEVYTVRGRIDLQKTGDQSPQFDFKQLSFAFEPSQQQVFSDGSFTLEIPVKPNQIGQLDFPTLTIEYAAPENPNQPYEVGTIHLNQNYPYEQDFKVAHDPKSRTIDVKPDIPLARRGYNPTVTPQPYIEGPP
jgi:hypothetical protein